MRWPVLTLILGTLLSACATTTTTTSYSTMSSAYQYHQQAFHIKIHWSYKDRDHKPVGDLRTYAASGKTIWIEGLVENYSSSAEVFDVELLVLVFDGGGNSQGSLAGRPQDYIIRPGQLSPFIMAIPLNGQEARVAIKEKYEWRDHPR